MAPQDETLNGNRRNALKKVGTFAVPAVATFSLSEMKVHASGINSGAGEMDRAWNNFWGPNRTTWLTKNKSWREGEKDFWWTIWNLLQ